MPGVAQNRAPGASGPYGARSRSERLWHTPIWPKMGDFRPRHPLPTPPPAVIRLQRLIQKELRACIHRFLKPEARRIQISGPGGPRSPISPFSSPNSTRHTPREVIPGVLRSPKKPGFRGCDTQNRVFAPMLIGKVGGQNGTEKFGEKNWRSGHSPGT